MKSLKLLEKNRDLQETFASFGDEESPNEKQIEACEEFVCKLYGRQKMKDVNAARLDIFLKKFKPKDTEYPLSKIKTADSVSLPPCTKVLLEKVKRSNYVCSVWESAKNANPPSHNPENCGWKLEEDRYTINWFDGDPSPSSLELVCEKDEEVDSENEDFEHDSDEEDGSDEEE